MPAGSTPQNQAEDQKITGEVPACCITTIRQHALYNPMMVCSGCKQIIKCFREEKPYRNYLTFCQSRRRHVLKGQVEGYFTIVFRSYENYR